MPSRKPQTYEADGNERRASKRLAARLIASLVFPPKPKQDGSADDKNPVESSPKTTRVSRKRRQDAIDSTDEPVTKRQQIIDPRLSIDLKSRMQLFLVLQGCKTWNTYDTILNMTHKSNEVKFALALNDSPQKLRLKALERLDHDTYTRILALICEIQLDRKRFDPTSSFPTVVTYQLLAALLSDQTSSTSSAMPSCLICQSKFVDGTDVVWKGCGKHLMHEECFREKATEGEIWLRGPCNCINM